MGRICHNAVIATTCDESAVQKVLEFIDKLEANEKRVFLIGQKLLNGYTTVVMVPDGSKEGWSFSNEMDELRSVFIDVLVGNSKICPWDFFEIRYGDSQGISEDFLPRILISNHDR